ncbi:hypothetical protein CAPTEDRAFT_218651 [Capitella teleta]|uniref:Alpha-galactosidase n=1 Tax=Capitella teleta TaxID=283909 RepID=R7UXF5_CAPTE|nr:hypothetical protein CAPTEDRAFT_218651 [Capitella teleta]|eukprot:ELU11029.1 hypothetical protein CAPTEDRAFT_218651 [Capitella teleta]
MEASGYHVVGATCDPRQEDGWNCGIFALQFLINRVAPKKVQLLPPQQGRLTIARILYNESVRKLIDQMEEVGFEMLIYSFKSGFDFESTNETYIENLAQDVAYANSKGIEVGGHDLLVWDKDKEGFPSKWVADTKSSYHGACMASGWYDHILEQYTSIMKRTGMTMIEADGPYPGYGCYSSNHSYHKGYQDSVYMQTKLQGQFFKVLHERGVYINQPDAYFFYGANKAVMGYKESQYALPRWQDLSVSRQGMFDDTFQFTPTIGWMIVPLVDYKTQAGADGMFEPLSENIKSYEWALAQYLGAGVAACYRGFRLYDTNETKVVVKKWVDFYKKYREILSSDIIHVRRPDMQSLDCFMHVNHRLSHRALAMVFNPTLHTQAMNLTLPLYYTGLNDKALIRREEGQLVEFLLNRDYKMEVEVELEPLGITWFVVEQSDSFCGNSLFVG